MCASEVVEWIEHLILRYGCKFQGSRAICLVERKKLQKYVERTPVVQIYMGSSIETVAYQVYEILKINHEFLQFF